MRGCKAIKQPHLLETFLGGSELEPEFWDKGNREIDFTQSHQTSYKNIAFFLNIDLTDGEWIVEQHSM